MFLRILRISGHSMEPEFSDNDIVVVGKFPFVRLHLKKGDVVVFRYKKDLLLKRVKKIDNGKVFLVGNNRGDSFDSRKFGWIKKSDVLGKVRKIYRI